MECEICGIGVRNALFEEGCDEYGSVSAYADDMTIVIGGKKLDILSRKITGAVGQLADFLAANDLCVN